MAEHLIGADEVARAGRRIAESASDTMRAAAMISAALEQHERFLDDWLIRFETVRDKAIVVIPHTGR